ncbi:4'-phosphopantetheinyl transferase [Bradyrhizobium sp. SZCCHNR2035]|uniref:4'-phosphopantetheinyl transferase family protein n=1 Tax=Bradyrhizobium sp. SZCCHNR2035 TaxID=3057386 RepID=UPI0029166265|nr:4'-phosphopantetheinyl transferase superfamily protein [Bradyrhizobium sp. SZCCHNR2035]
MKIADFRTMLPDFVAMVSIVDDGQDVPLDPREAHCVQNAAPPRKRDFALGRRCARRALEFLGHHDAFIDSNPDRSPRWPPGLIGSITHTSGYAAAVAANETHCRAIGIDAERTGRIAPALWNSLFDSSEMEFLRSSPYAQQDALATLMFSAKEAYYKAAYPVTRRWLNFHDVHVSISGTRFAAFEKTSSGLTAADGRYVIDCGLVLTVVTTSHPIGGGKCDGR